MTRWATPTASSSRARSPPSRGEDQGPAQRGRWPLRPLQEDQDQVQRQVPHVDRPGRQEEDLLQDPGPGHLGLPEDHLEGHRLHRNRVIFRTYAGLAPAGAGRAALGPVGYCRAGPVQVRVPPTNPHARHREEAACASQSRLTVDGDPSGRHDVAGPGVALAGVPRQRRRGREGQAEGQSINFAANGAKSFRLYGKLSPKANKKTAILQRAGKARGHYGKFRPRRPTSRASTTSAASRRKASTR